MMLDSHDDLAALIAQTAPDMLLLDGREGPAARELEKLAPRYRRRPP